MLKPYRRNHILEQQNQALDSMKCVAAVKRILEVKFSFLKPESPSPKSDLLVKVVKAINRNTAESSGGRRVNGRHNQCSLGHHVVICVLDTWKHFFNLINELPTVFEVVTGATKKQVKRSL
ncbi:hypothetical protein P8452_05438 [Trifolium repens]|nr:hypothetical protein P8452_05438 [Trifolium repens]